MARKFLDTSAVVKLYVNEPESALVQAHVDPADTLLITTLSALEFLSALYGKVRQRQLLEADADARVGLFNLDLPSFVTLPLGPAEFERERLLLERYGKSEGLRPPDALQVAAALLANERQPLEALVTTDQQQARVAVAEGLAVLPKRTISPRLPDGSDS